MKNRILVIILFFLSCRQVASKQGRNVIIRDTTITSTNAFTQLFFDSLNLGHFIENEVRGDSIANYMRSFYNSRNYSFAWFNKDGLTVQAQAFWSAHEMVVKQASDSSIYDGQLHHIIDTLLSDSTFILNKKQLEETEMPFSLVRKLSKIVTGFSLRLGICHSTFFGSTLPLYANFK